MQAQFCLKLFILLYIGGCVKCFSVAIIFECMVGLEECGAGWWPGM
jgi:hypothetical protein